MGLSLGATIRKLRSKRGLTLRALATLAGCAPATLLYCERGASVPRPATLAAVARALEVEAAELLLLGGQLPRGMAPRSLEQARQVSRRLRAHDRTLPRV